MIKGLFSLLGMFGVFQAPKEREKGSGAKCFLEEQRAPIDPRAGLPPPHPTLQAAGTLTLTQRPAPLKWRGWAGALVSVYVCECAKVKGEAMSVCEYVTVCECKHTGVCVNVKDSECASRRVHVGR